MPASTDMQAFQATLSASKNIIAVAGAGLSAASGIPTFRGLGGLWRKYDAIELATPRAFRANPSRSWQFYHYRREAALRATLWQNSRYLQSEAQLSQDRPLLS
ncbi:hypothetical protein E1B28_010858 [Marasmius oreades]|uniref:Deacetylase sirtuin-type domain-containing protein n=1 Tax=Marasmius oreades TaxID=181124 RepID=A0A9P7RTF0_9AGAR|nr:uncharacterized protein E1B28_010858 [Marasmius oreades]KAG7089152.1 hypothetical protein E1B28_010858 [Marasmius oreades]